MATAALREALNRGISSGSLVDTKIILYSYRDSSGRVCRPKALYANSRVLKTVPYFNDLLFGNFAESQSKVFSREEIDEEESGEDYGYLSDSDLEDDEDEKVPSCNCTSKSKTHPSDPPGTPGEDRSTIFEEREERVDRGKVVKIPDVALVTFQAFLMYLYTNAIEFAPFGSEENRRSRSAEIATLSDDKVPRPSPKSIYRLADKYDISVLKALALNHIRGGLGKCDIVEESFSRFASQYDEIRSLYVGQLAYVWMGEWTTETIRASVNGKIDSFIKGDLRHATETVSALWEAANKDGNINAPSNTSPAAAHVTGPTHWAPVRMVLVRSIRNGVYFDRKYWARHSKAGDVLKPVYFSSMIMEDKAQQLMKLVKYLKGGSALVSDLEGDANIESDCEGDPTGAGDGMPKEGKDESRAVLIAGSFSAWRSLFFYRCTGLISFAPLKSQGVDSRLSYIRQKTTVDAPPPCSPKSIHLLASLLEMQPLRDSAFADIKSKVSLDNAMNELFSWVAVSQERTTETQCDVLIPYFKNPNAIALVKENFGRISDGSSSHSADALKVGLKKAFELKRQNYARLRCDQVGCPWYTNHPSFSSVVSNVLCQSCTDQGWGSYYLHCTGCGYHRTGSGYSSCQSCGKTFL